ncbi:ROK family transcriptional regulator [Butyricicoccus sp. Marseille-Q5471]|uniref:ROK family transcriptional regulator n=1 Tax=Butyricicoccus sp. Marseille-Q5471 TaxID=3039493 RepID=UPI0024BC270B|nr:ROK family transcriptional regulator [Butyricicoccus sp. Marseille-Q5471]
MAEKMSTAELRRRNRRNVYHYFYNADAPRTKQEIAAALHLSLPTVTQNLRDLMEQGLIEYAGLIDSTGGRRARTMQMAADARFSVGVELSPKHIRIVAIDLLANEIAFQRISCPFSNDAAYRQQLLAAVEAFLDAFHLDRARLLGIGVTLPGIINEARGLIEVAPILGIRKMNLALLTELFPYPVFVENDASAGGYAEWWNRSDLDSMAYLFLGKGVGGALLIGGRPYAGVNRRSGEFGHMGIVPDGRPCSCGKRGCLEAYCSVSRLTDDLDLQIEEFFEKLQQGDADCFAIWKQYMDDLAVGINSIRMVMDCDVVLGGMITPFMEDYLPDIRTRLAALNSFGDDGRYLHLGKCRAKANCIGVALHFVDTFINE